MNYPMTGMAFSAQQVNNLLDAWALIGIKIYFFPFFLAGISDNITDLFKPQTYSICK